MLADQFGMPLDHVTIHHGDTAVVKQGIGFSGRSIMSKCRIGLGAAQGCRPTSRSAGCP